MGRTIAKGGLGKVTVKSVFVGILVLSLCSLAAAQEKVGELSFYQGKVEVKRVDRLTQVSLNQDILIGDVITTGENSRASIRLVDRSVVILDQGTVYEPKGLENVLSRGSVFVRMLREKLGGGKKFRVSTPTAVAAISGTEFFLQEVDKSAPMTVLGETYFEGASIVVGEGAIDFSNDVGRIKIKENQWGLLKKGQRPNPPVDVDASQFIPAWVKEVLEAEGGTQE